MPSSALKSLRGRSDREFERDPRLVLVVINNGRQAVALEEAGFAIEFSEHGRWPRRRKRVSVSYAEVDGPDLPLSLGPGIPAEFRLPVEGIQAKIEDIPRGFALASRGRLRLAEPPFGQNLLRYLKSPHEYLGLQQKGE